MSGATPVPRSATSLSSGIRQSSHHASHRGVDLRFFILAVRAAALLVLLGARDVEDLDLVRIEKADLALDVFQIDALDHLLELLVLLLGALAAGVGLELLDVGVERVAELDQLPRGEL